MHPLISLDCDRTKQMFKASYNEHKSCPGTSLLTGSCVSGKDADCEGHFNTLYCQNGMYSQRVIHVLCQLIISVFVCFPECY